MFRFSLISAVVLVGALHRTPVRQPTRRRTTHPLHFGRREALGGTVAAISAGCACCSLSPQPACALAALVRDEKLERSYEIPRDLNRDAGFARGMATGMQSYESAVRPTKLRLFENFRRALPPSDAVIVELGMGSFPNAPFYTDTADLARLQRLDIIGVDPNDSMSSFATRNAKRYNLDGEHGHSVRCVHGIGEALPFAAGSVDAVVSTLTLCSVPNVERSLAEVRRVLKPGGQFLFLEHVLSETDEGLAATQRLLTPMQVAQADGCHLDRQTLRSIRAAGFGKVDAEYFELKGFLYLSPTVAGIATI